MVAIRPSAPIARSARLRIPSDVWWCLALVCLVLLYYGRYLGLLGTRMTFVQSDFTEVYWPFHAFNVQQWLAGRVPLWDGSIFGGYPLVASLEAATFAPLGLLELAAARAADPLLGMYIRLAATSAVACLGTYALARRLTGSPPAAALAAIVVALGGFATNYAANQIDMLEGFAWLPLCLFFLDRALSGRHWMLDGWLAGFAFGLALLGGYPQMWLFYPLAGAALAAGRASSWRRAAAASAASLLAGLSLAAVQLLPAIELWMNSNRLNSGNALGYSWQDLIGFALPRADRAMFVGIIPVALALLTAGLVLAGRLHACRIAISLWVLAAVTWLMAMGGNTPLFQLVWSRLGLGLFRGQSRMVALCVLALALLAAYGLAWLQERLQKAGPWLAGGLIALAALNLITLNWLNNGPRPAPYVPTMDRFPTLVPALDHDQQQDGPWRYDIDSEKEIFEPDEAFMHSLQTISGYIDFQLKRVADLRASQAYWRQWQLFNVRDIVSRRDLSGPGVQEIPAAADGPLRLFQMQYPLPRAYVVWDVKLASSPAQALAMTLDGKLDPGKTAILERSLPAGLAVPPNGGAQVATTLVSPGESRMQVQSPAAGLLVISQAYYPGWKAFIDGRPAALFETDYALDGIPVPAGSHTVRLVYDPLSFKLGAAVSILSLAAFGALALAYRLGKFSRS